MRVKINWKDKNGSPADVTFNKKQLLFHPFESRRVGFPPHVYLRRGDTAVNRSTE